MKKQLLFGMAAVFLYGTTALAQNLTVEIKKAAEPIVIDGQVDDVWTGANEFVINSWGKNKPVPDEADFSAKFQLAWDNDFLYFIGYITDDILLDSATISTQAIVDWEVDNWETYFSPGNSYIADMSKSLQVRLHYQNLTSANNVAKVVNGWSEDGFTMPNFVTAAKSESGDGYIIEAKFALAAMATAAKKEKIGANDTIGFNAVACDNDGEAKRENIGNCITGFTWNEADTMMRLVLVDQGLGLKANNNSKVSAYPTVVKNQLMFTNSSDIKSVEIYSLEGKLVMRSKVSNGNMSVALLTSGLYNVRITTNSGSVINQKIIKK